MPSLLGRIAHPAIELLIKLRVFDAARLLFPNTLTVLNYHRIDDPQRLGFDTFKPNVSATPAQFAIQMDYVKKNYNVVTCQELVSFLHGESSLPPHAAMITFDDGYYDNLSNAFPILRERNLPAVIFLTSSFIGSDTLAYWDYVAYCFYHTKKKSAHLPLIGECNWSDEPSCYSVMERWIETIKRIPEVEKKELVQEIGNILGVNPPVGMFANLYLTWDQVREMSQSGLIEFGSHTVSHPILTRITPEEAECEIEESRKRIEQEISKPVISLAYPNGGPADFSPDVIRAAKNAGIKVSFTLLAGPTQYGAVKAFPFEIRRIFLIYNDNFSRFVMKLSGLARVLRR